MNIFARQIKDYKTFKITVVLCIFTVLLIYMTCCLFVSVPQNLKSHQNDIAYLVEKNSNPADYTKYVQLCFENGDALPKTLYIIGETNGYIAIYSGSDNKLLCKLNVRVSLLPDTDQAYLKNGIKVYSDSEFLSVVSNYTS